MSTPELKPETQPELKEALALVSRNLMFHAKPTFAAFVDTAIVRIAKLESALNAAREAIENAPHHQSCPMMATAGWDETKRKCDCWKAEALAQLNIIHEIPNQA